MCGIFGLTGLDEAARLTYFGLYALQHRGQESAGIVSCDNKNTYSHIGMGLVQNVFTEDILSEQLLGNMAIGHVRYSTTGKPKQKNAQPFVVSIRGKTFSLAHNGNLTNILELKSELEKNGAIFQTSSDSEIFIHLIAHELKNLSLEEAIIKAINKVEGAYSLLILYDGKLIALRDPYGFHPLVMGKMPHKPQSWIFSSESCAFDLLGANILRDVEPGEMIVIEPEATEYKSYNFKQDKATKQCIFELIYFARPDSYIFGEDVYQCRKKMGYELANEDHVAADYVMPFPDSGVYSAVGYAQASQIPYEHALIRNHYVGRTFIQPSQSMREFSVRVKINPVKSIINNKNLVIVDDSIVRGTTVQTRCANLRELGAAKIYFRVACPPIKFPCYYGIDFPSPKELIANKYNTEQLSEILGLDSLHYLSIQALKKCVSKPDNYCYACFDGHYPSPVPINTNKFSLEN